MKIAGPWGETDYTVVLTRAQADVLIRVFKFMLTHPGHPVTLGELIDGRSWKAVEKAVESIEDAIEHPELYRHIQTGRPL